MWILLRLLRSARPAIVYSDLRLFDNLPIGRASRVRWISALLRSLAILSIIVAMIGPRIPDRDGGYRLPTEGIAMVLVLDVSGSMGAKDFEWQPGEAYTSRMEAAKRALRLFVEGGSSPDGEVFEGRPTDLVGLVTFSVWPHPICPMTLSHGVLLKLLDEQQPADELSAGSNVGDAITEGVIQLEHTPGRRKVMVIFSDGEHNFDLDPPRKPNKPRQAAQLAASRGIPIYAIDTGGEPIAPGDAKDTNATEAYKQRLAGRRTLESVVELTGGRMFTANNSREMLQVCHAIDELERQTILSFRYRRYVELDVWFGGAALLLWVLGWCLERGPWRRLP